MKHFIRLLSVSLASAALVGCSFNGRIPSSRAEYPDVQARGYSAMELLDMPNDVNDNRSALVYKLQAGSANDPAYAEIRRRAFAGKEVIDAQVAGALLRDVATCTAFRIGVELITSPQQGALPREVIRQAGYTILNGPGMGYLLRPPGFAVDQGCLAAARSQVAPPPGGWIGKD